MISYHTLFCLSTIGIPEFSTEQLILKHCYSRTKITCFKKLSMEDIESVRKEFYGLKSETVQYWIISADTLLVLIKQKYCLQWLERRCVMVVGAWCTEFDIINLNHLYPSLNMGLYQ